MSDRYIEKKPFLPASYVEHIEAYNGWEGALAINHGYLVLWDKETIQDRWEAYQMAEFLGDRWFAFGSDGGDEMMCFDLQSDGDAVFWLPFIGMADEEPILLCNSFSELSKLIREVS